MVYATSEKRYLVTRIIKKEQKQKSEENSLYFLKKLISMSRKEKLSTETLNKFF